MPSGVESLQETAKKLFLGRGGVLGVGIGEDAGRSQLVFLLNEDRPETRKELSDWAALNDVAIDFLVTGPVRIEYPEQEA